MLNIINWCNHNQGFLSFVLSVVTILISIFAIYISINTAKIPFTIKLKAIPTVYSSPEGLYVDLLIYNQGYIKIGLASVHISDPNNIVIGMYEGEPLYIESGSFQKCKIGIFPASVEYLEKHIMNMNDKIIITIYDSFGNKYEFKNGFPVG